MDKVLTHLTCESIKVPANYRRFLAYPDAFWWIESGEGAIFSMERTGHLVEGRKLNKGPLTHIGNVVSRSMVFGFPVFENDPLAILMISHKPMKWKKGSLFEIKKYVDDHPESIVEIMPHFDKWVIQIMQRFHDFAIQESSKTIKAGEESEIELGDQLFQPDKGKVVWIEVEEGEAYLFNFPTIKITKESGPFPLTENTWLSTPNKAKIKAFLHSQSSLDPLFVKGFQYFQHMALLLFECNVKRKKETEQIRIQQRKKEDEIAVDHALALLASPLQEKRDLPVAESHNTLFYACQLIGHKMGIEFVLPSERYLFSSPQEQLTKICEESHVKFRLVSLKKGFWKHDARSLLAFYKDTQKPVALLSVDNHYEVIDPETKNRKRLDEKIMSQLYPQAYLFYLSFPDVPLTGKKIIEFSLKGRQKESFAILMMGLLGALISLIPPFLTKSLFNEVLGRAQDELLWQIIFGLVVVTIVSSLFLLTRALLMLRFTQLIDFRLESALWERILQLPANFFRQFTVGNLIARVYAVTQIHQLLSGTTIKVALSGLFSFFYFFAMVYFSPMLAFIGLGIIFISLGLLLFCIFKKAMLLRLMLAVAGIAHGFVVQILGGIAKLRVAGMGNRAFSHWSRYQKDILALGMQAQTMQNIIILLTSTLPIISSAILFGVVVVIMEHKGELPMSIGSLIAFFAAFVPFSTAVFDMGNAIMGAIKAVPLWERAKIILQEPPESGKEKANPGILDGSLRVEQLSFRYDKDTPLVLDQMSLYAEPGEFVAIAGPSGCGKTTLVRLLLGFEKQETGVIYYNGLDLAGLNVSEVRKQIGTVLQAGSIFAGTLYDNLVCGGHYTKEEIAIALEISQFSQDLKEMPMGLHTYVQSGGGTFSVGQLQRLLIARALISKPKILLFDEATSALDNKTQDQVSRALDQLKVTRIVIAHRLSTIRNADRIYMIEKGKVVQEGNFEELSSKEGLFKAMLDRQKL